MHREQFMRGGGEFRPRSQACNAIQRTQRAEAESGCFGKVLSRSFRHAMVTLGLGNMPGKTNDPRKPTHG
jgi:hypothetical protein